MNARLSTFVVGLAIALLSGCGGGGGGGGGSSAPASSTLGGVAAVGYPIVNGAIQVKCAGGSALTGTTTSAGAWQVTISGQTLPCAVEVSGGTINGAANSTPYHSIATSFGIMNVTLLTDLMVGQSGRHGNSRYMVLRIGHCLVCFNHTNLGQHGAHQAAHST